MFCIITIAKAFQFCIQSRAFVFVFFDSGGENKYAHLVSFHLFSSKHVMIAADE